MGLIIPVDVTCEFLAYGLHPMLMAHSDGSSLMGLRLRLLQHPSNPRLPAFFFTPTIDDDDDDASYSVGRTP